MSLSEQLQRVDGGQIAALKALIEKYGGTVPDGVKIDGYANIISGLGIYSQDEMLSDETRTALGLPNTAVPDDAFMVLQAGNCKIEHGSYKGTGNYSSAHPNRLTFSGEPLLVIVYGASRGATLVNWLRKTVATASVGDQYSPSISAAWGSNYISWYADSADVQLNQTNTTYCFVGLLSASE